MRSSAVVYVADLPRMAAFYREVFSLDEVDGGDGFVVLESEALTLSLVEVPAAVAGRIDASRPPVRREATPVKLGFPVGCIEDLRARFAALGGGLDPPGTRWELRGRTVCDGVDPEGNVVQVTEPAPGAASPGA